MNKTNQLTQLLIARLAESKTRELENLQNLVQIHDQRGILQAVGDSAFGVDPVEEYVRKYATSVAGNFATADEANRNLTIEQVVSGVESAILSQGKKSQHGVGV